MDEHERIAASIFRRHGLDFETAERAGGWTNAVWLNGCVCLRLSMKRDTDRIRRETERSKMLPPLAGYPKNIAVGVTDGYEWSLSERIPGVVLSSVWDNFSWQEKTKAVKQISAIMNAVHSVEVGAVEHITLRESWYSPFDKDKSLSDMERYVRQKLFTPAQGLALTEILERFYSWNTCIPPVLCHGDITADNLLWHEGNVVSLLDFEHAVIAPRQLDVHSLVNLALIPYDESASADIVLFTLKDREIESYITETIPLFLPFLSEQSDKDLFMGYNVLYRQRFLEFWLDEPGQDIGLCDAYQKLLSFSNGGGGYLSVLTSGN